MVDERPRQWRVTRTWAVVADNYSEAIERALPGEHVSVRALAPEPDDDAEGPTPAQVAARFDVPEQAVVLAREVIAEGVLWNDVDPEAGDPLADAVVQRLRPWLRLLDEPAPKAILRLTLLHGGKVEVSLEQGRPTSDVAMLLRQMADGFENDPRRLD